MKNLKCVERKFVNDIPGISLIELRALSRIKIRSIAELLAYYIDKGIVKLYSETNISIERLKDILNAGDLMRVRGLSSKRVKLLNLCNIYTLSQLASQKIDELKVNLDMTNNVHRICNISMSVSAVETLIERAGNLPILLHKLNEKAY